MYPYQGKHEPHVTFLCLSSIHLSSTFHVTSTELGSRWSMTDRKVLVLCHTEPVTQGSRDTNVKKGKPQITEVNHEGHWETMLRWSYLEGSH